jgi:hypothetical protein
MTTNQQHILNGIINTEDEARQIQVHKKNNITRKVDKQTRIRKASKTEIIRKASNNTSSVDHQLSKMNKGEIN